MDEGLILGLAADRMGRLPCRRQGTRIDPVHAATSGVASGSELLATHTENNKAKADLGDYISVKVRDDCR